MKQEAKAHCRAEDFFDYKLNSVVLIMLHYVSLMFSAISSLKSYHWETAIVIWSGGCLQDLSYYWQINVFSNSMRLPDQVISKEMLYDTCKLDCCEVIAYTFLIVFCFGKFSQSNKKNVDFVCLIRMYFLSVFKKVRRLHGFLWKYSNKEQTHRLLLIMWRC